MLSHDVFQSSTTYYDLLILFSIQICFDIIKWSVPEVS